MKDWTLFLYGSQAPVFVSQFGDATLCHCFYLASLPYITYWLLTLCRILLIDFSHEEIASCEMHFPSFWILIPQFLAALVISFFNAFKQHFFHLQHLYVLLEVLVWYKLVCYNWNQKSSHWRNLSLGIMSSDLHVRKMFLNKPWKY